MRELFAFFRIKASRSMPFIHGYKLVDDGAFRAEDQRVQGRSRVWAVAAAAALSSEASGRWAPSGLALLHLDSPRLDGSGSLHVRGSRGRLLQRHSSQAGLFIHSFCLLNVVSLYRAHVNC